MIELSEQRHIGTGLILKHQTPGLPACWPGNRASGKFFPAANRDL